MKQTAVKWLEDKIQSDMTFMEILGLINQAKAMEKEQIKMCCIKTMETCNSDMNELGCKTMDDYFNYIHNETFKSE